VNDIVSAFNVEDIIKAVKEQKVLYESESANASAKIKKLREEASDAVVAQLIPD